MKILKTIVLSMALFILNNNNLKAQFTGTNPLTTISDVGIGTRVPENAGGWSRVLDVRGNGHAKIVVTTADASIITGLWSHLGGTSGAPAGGMTGTATNHPFTFFTNAIPRMLIDNSGKIGIGITTPSSKLHVFGNNTFNEPAVYLEGRTYASKMVARGIINLDFAYGTWSEGWGINSDTLNTTSVGVWGQGIYGNQSFGVIGTGSANSNANTVTAEYGVYGTTRNTLSGQSNGNSNSSYALFADGATYSSGYYTSSDAKLKKDIKPILNPFEIINKLNPKTYIFSDDNEFN